MDYIDRALAARRRGAITYTNNTATERDLGWPALPDHCFGDHEAAFITHDHICGEFIFHDAIAQGAPTFGVLELLAALAAGRFRVMTDADFAAHPGPIAAAEGTLICDELDGYTVLFGPETVPGAFIQITATNDAGDEFYLTPAGWHDEAWGPDQS